MVDKFLAPLEWVRSNYASLSRAQKKAADFILEQGDVVAFQSLKKTAAAAGVTPVTLVRMLKELGYTGYAEFKKALQSYIHVLSRPPFVVKDSLDGFKEDNLQQALESAIENELYLVRETYQFLDHTALLNAVALIKNARKIYLAASGIVLPVARTLQMRLLFLHLDAELLAMDEVPILPARLERASSEDVFIIFSFPNYLMALGAIAQCAQIQGSKVICLTDHPVAPPVSHADLTLFCQTSSLVFFNSMTAVISLVNVLATLLVIESEDQPKRDTAVKRIIQTFYPEMSGPFTASEIKSCRSSL